VLIAASGIAMAKTRQPTRERRENPPIKPFGDVPRAAMVETLELGPDNRFAAGPTLSPLSRLRGNVIK
jgi:hypothetical protein